MVLLRVSPSENTFNTGNYYSRSLKKSSCWRKLILQRFSCEGKCSVSVGVSGPAEPPRPAGSGHLPGNDVRASQTGAAGSPIDPRPSRLIKWPLELQPVQNNHRSGARRLTDQTDQTDCSLRPDGPEKLVSGLIERLKNASVEECGL